MDDRYANLLPPALIASLRSMPRRYAEIIGVGEPLTGEQLLESGAGTEIGSMLAQLMGFDQRGRVGDAGVGPLAGEHFRQLKPLEDF